MTFIIIIKLHSKYHYYYLKRSSENTNALVINVYGVNTKQTQKLLKFCENGLICDTSET